MPKSATDTCPSANITFSSLMSRWTTPCDEHGEARRPHRGGSLLGVGRRESHEQVDRFVTDGPRHRHYVLERKEDLPDTIIVEEVARFHDPIHPGGHDGRGGRVDD